MGGGGGRGGGVGQPFPGIHIVGSDAKRRASMKSSERKKRRGDWGEGASVARNRKSSIKPQGGLCNFRPQEGGGGGLFRIFCLTNAM